MKKFSNTYRSKAALPKTVVPNPKATSVCGGCGAIYEKKRWSENETRSRELKHDPRVDVVQCPACVRAKADYPEGILTLSGEFLREHHDEILHTIVSTAKRERARDALCRLMGIKSSPEGIVVKATNERLVRRLGHVLHAAYDGDLTFVFSRDVRLTRVRWHRDAPGRADSRTAKEAAKRRKKK